MAPAPQRDLTARFVEQPMPVKVVLTAMAFVATVGLLLLSKTLGDDLGSGLQAAYTALFAMCAGALGAGALVDVLANGRRPGAIGAIPLLALGTVGLSMVLVPRLIWGRVDGITEAKWTVVAANAAIVLGILSWLILVDAHEGRPASTLFLVAAGTGLAQVTAIAWAITRDPRSASPEETLRALTYGLRFGVAFGAVALLTGLEVLRRALAEPADE